MTWQQTIDEEKEIAFEEGRTEGFADGITQKAQEAAENFLKMNVLSLEQISQGTGLPLDKVQELANNILVNS